MGLLINFLSFDYNWFMAVMVTPNEFNSTDLRIDQ